MDGIVQAVDDGRLSYDESRADALFDRFDAPNPLCVEEPFRALGLDSLEVYSLAGTFTGTRGLGESCTLPVGYKGGISDCREGICAGTSEDSGVCVALVGEGEPCDESGDENLDGSAARVCFEQRPSDSDGEYESAFDRSSCVPTAGGDRVCVIGLEAGAECDRAAACASGLCEATADGGFTCAPKRADGEVCETHRQCLSGACQPGAEPRECGPLLADGQPCEYSDGACAGGACSGDESGGTCIAAPTVALGGACDNSSACVTNGNDNPALCQGGVCIADICTG
jgi:hypothetical protein